MIDCAEELKVRYGTHMLAEEADEWWVDIRTEMEQDGVALTWAVFRRAFPRRYFPEDIRGKKEIEFLELKQGNKTVSEYASTSSGKYLLRKALLNTAQFNATPSSSSSVLVATHQSSASSTSV